MSDLVYVDPALNDGEPLVRAVFAAEFESSWVIQSAAPKTGNIDEYERLDKEKVLLMYPELKELFDLQLQKTIIFIKGKNSGKWYDFHT